MMLYASELGISAAQAQFGVRLSVAKMWEESSSSADETILQENMRSRAKSGVV